MKRSQKLTQEINDLTMKIARDYPELYHYLDETPITISYGKNFDLNTELADYLDSLKHLIKQRLTSAKKVK
jgi:hypothetical protein